MSDDTQPSKDQKADKGHTLVYKSPGKHIGPLGTSYTYKQAKTPEEFSELLKAGWFKTVDEAVKVAKAEAKK